jgi:hypothetical protein
MFAIQKSAKLAISLRALIIVFMATNSVSFAQTKGSDKSVSSKRGQTIKKLEEIIIDRIDFEDDNIDMAVKILAEKSGMNIVLKQTPREKQTKNLVDMVLVKRSLMDTIYFFCKATNMNYHIEEDSVIISSAPNPVEREELRQKMAKKSALTQKKLQNIFFPKVKLTNANLYSVVQELHSLSKRYDPDKSGVYITISHNTACAAKVAEYPEITMDLKNISMDKLLSYLNDNFGIIHRIENGIVILYSKNNKRAQTIKKLENIVFPEIKFENADIFTVIRYLNSHGKRNDPDKKGISLTAGFDTKTAYGLTKVTMKYSNISMYEILNKLCNYTGLQYEIEDGAVVIFIDSDEIQ